MKNMAAFASIFQTKYLSYHVLAFSASCCLKLCAISLKALEKLILKSYFRQEIFVLIIILWKLYLLLQTVNLDKENFTEKCSI